MKVFGKTIKILTNYLLNASIKLMNNLKVGTTMSRFLDDLDKEVKERINLSEYATLIINDDIRNFYSLKEKENKTEFYNIIFKNFYKDADASISLRLNEKKQELEEFYSSKDLKLDTKTINILINKQLEKEKETIMDKIKKYGKSSNQPIIRINNSNKKIFKDSVEDIYYEGSIARYIKAIFEEYALKPVYEREKIFFYDTYEYIDSMIKHNAQATIDCRECLEIKLASKHQNETKINQRTYYVSPYKILPNKTNTYNYLIGYSLEKGSNKSKKESVIASFRISNIKEIDKSSTKYSDRPGYISKEKEKEIEQSITKRGVDFLAGEVEEIKVQFSPKGIDYLKRHIYMRPNNYKISEDNNRIYIFSCTRMQAIAYFFKFGWDAQIIEPIDLRDDFIYRYESALKSYQGISREQIKKESKKEKRQNNIKK